LQLRPPYLRAPSAVVTRFSRTQRSWCQAEPALPEDPAGPTPSQPVIFILAGPARCFTCNPADFSPPVSEATRFYQKTITVPTKLWSRSGCRESIAGASRRTGMEFGNRCPLPAAIISNLCLIMK